MVELVMTDADKILDFIQGKEEVSIEDISKQLNMSVSTIESLATLLEEEGLLKIKYKLTTPYLIPTKKGGEKKAPSPQRPEPQQTFEMPEQQLPEKPYRQGSPETESEEEDFESRDLLSPGVSKSASELINEARNALEGGDYKRVQELSGEIERYRTTLPQRYEQEDAALRNALVVLKEESIERMNKNLDATFEEKRNEFIDILNKGKQKLGQGIQSKQDIRELERSYKTLKDIFFDLPSSYTEQKAELQNELLSFYRTVLHQKKEYLLGTFGKNVEEIRSLMSSCRTHLEKDETKKAEEIFDTITERYAALPDGFLEQKTELQNDILTLYQQVLTKKSESSQHTYGEVIAKAETMLKEGYDAVKIDNIGEAERLITAIADLIAELPDSETGKRIELEESLLELQRITELKKNKELYARIQDEAYTVQKTVETGMLRLDAGDLDGAREQYEKAVTLYNRLPHNFSRINKTLQKNIVKLYAGIMTFEYEESDADGETREQYEKLLDLVTTIQDRMLERDYREIKELYKEAYQLYHELPTSLEEKQSLYEDIHKIYEELMLWSTLEKAKRAAENRDVKSLDELADSTISLYRQLKKKYPEDIDLLRYIKQQYLLLLQSMKKEARTGKDVRESITAVQKEIET